MKTWAIGLVVLFGLSCGSVSLAADFTGDGTGDIAVFRASSGMWSVRGVTRIYMGSTGDIPVPGDYDGSGTDQAAIFRATGGLWSVRDVTRVYFGGASDDAMPGDYNGDGTYDVATFRGSAGLWAARNITRVYFGGSTDVAISPGKARASGEGRLLKTGQTTVYQAGDDGTYQKGIAFNYQTSDPAANGEIVTTDKVTGLMWASDGNGKGCSFGNYTDWEHAINWAEGLTFAGYSDWRLPNIRELHSLVNFGAWDPAINTTYFPNTRAAYYWSGSTHADDTYRAWLVLFYYGYVVSHNKTTNDYVRAVRGGE
jgi:hypothetical protein